MLCESQPSSSPHQIRCYNSVSIRAKSKVFRVVFGNKGMPTHATAWLQGGSSELRTSHRTLRRPPPSGVVTQEPSSQNLPAATMWPASWVRLRSPAPSATKCTSPRCPPRRTLRWRRAMPTRCCSLLRLTACGARSTPCKWCALPSAAQSCPPRLRQHLTAATAAAPPLPLCRHAAGCAAG